MEAPIEGARPGLHLVPSDPMLKMALEKKFLEFNNIFFVNRLRRRFGAAWKTKSEAGKMKAKADEKLVSKVLVKKHWAR